jgi:hypothetical protein
LPQLYSIKYQQKYNTSRRKNRLTETREENKINEGGRKMEEMNGKIKVRRMKENGKGKDDRELRSR